MFRAIAGMGLLIVGGIVRGIGARGLAGSGVVLDPDKAHEELEPYSRMAGGMVRRRSGRGQDRPRWEAREGHRDQMPKLREAQRRRLQVLPGMRKETVSRTKQMHRTPRMTSRFHGGRHGRGSVIREALGSYASLSFHSGVDCDRGGSDASVYSGNGIYCLSLASRGTAAGRATSLGDHRFLRSGRVLYDGSEVCPTEAAGDRR